MPGLFVGFVANVSNTEAHFRYCICYLSVNTVLICYICVMVDISVLWSCSQYRLTSCRAICRQWFNFHEEFFLLFLLPPIILYPTHYCLHSILIIDFLMLLFQTFCLCLDSLLFFLDIYDQPKFSFVPSSRMSKSQFCVSVGLWHLYGYHPWPWNFTESGFSLQPVLF